MSQETLGDVLLGLVGAAVIAGISAGLVVEFGGAGRLNSRWRRFIGMGGTEQSPARPRAWAAATGLTLLVLVEGTAVVRLSNALIRGDGLGAAAFGVHVALVLVSMLYLWRGKGMR